MNALADILIAAVQWIAIAVLGTLFGYTLRAAMHQLRDPNPKPMLKRPRR